MILVEQMDDNVSNQTHGMMKSSRKAKTKITHQQLKSLLSVTLALYCFVTLEPN